MKMHHLSDLIPRLRSPGSRLYRIVFGEITDIILQSVRGGENTFASQNIEIKHFILTVEIYFNIAPRVLLKCIAIVLGIFCHFLKIQLLYIDVA